MNYPDLDSILFAGPDEPEPATDDSYGDDEFDYRRENAVGWAAEEDSFYDDWLAQITAREQEADNA